MQRGRNLTNEYAVKWFIFWDSLTRQRTDGALSLYTLPFVFPEARHLTGRDGPLRHLTWYRSENPRLG